jgi:hypothetical protein
MQLSTTSFPRVIKIDAEGAEIPVLRGASNLLREKHPTLIVEVDKENQPRFGFTADSLLQELKDFGYSLSPLGNGPGSDRVTSMFRRRLESPDYTDTPEQTDRDEFVVTRPSQEEAFTSWFNIRLSW